MSNIPTPQQHLMAENKALRARLSEAEETLHAIRAGEVDALVLTGAKGDSILTLKGSLEPYRVMVEAMNEGAVTLAVDGTILYCNGHFADWVRVPLAQIVGTSLKDVLAEQDQEKLDVMLVQGAKGESRGALTLQAADGSQTPALFSMSPLPHSEGRVISVIIADLSEVVTASEARSRLALIVESSDDAIVSISLDGVVESWNRAAEQLFEYTAEEAIGHTLESLIVPPERIDAFTHEFEALRRGESTLLTDAVRQRKGGSQVNVSIKVSPILNEAGEVVGASTNSRDITARRQGEKSLKLFRALLNYSNDAIEVLEPSTLRFLDVNDTDCRLLGYSRDELLGMTVFDVDPAFTPERAAAAETRMREEGGIIFEGVHRRRDGFTFAVEVTSKLVELDKPYILSIAHDITERKAAERVLQKKEKQLSEALEIARIGYWEYEFATDEFIFNDQYYQLHSITAEEAGGYRMTSSDFISRYVYPDDTPIVSKHIQWAFESRDPKYFAMTEVRILSGKQEIAWVEVRIRIEKDLQGNTILLKGVNQDITNRKLADLKLLESDRRFTDMLGNVELISVMRDNEERITYCNEYLLRLTGWRYEEIIGKDWIELFVPPEISAQKRLFFSELLIDSPEARHHESEILTRSRDHRLIRWNNTLLRSEKGDVIGTASIGEDITEWKKSEARIKSLNRVLSVLSGINTLIVRVNDREALFREACNLAVKEGGFRMAMIVIVDQNTMLPTSVVSAGKDDALLAAIKNVMSSSEGMHRTLFGQTMREKNAVISNDTKNDTNVIFGEQYDKAGVKSMAILPLITSGEVVGALGLYASELEFFHTDEMTLLGDIADDIAFAIDHLDKQERLNYLAYYDVLTGLANHTLFLERLAQYIHSAANGGHKIALGLIDLERFKNINDALGRPSGDALLKQVTEWLVLKTGDHSLLARIDADHFAIVLPKVTSNDNLAMLTENLAAAFVAHPFNLNEAFFRIGVKVGIALYPDNGENAENLFTNAEAALKMAKESGNRYLIHTQEMTDSVASKLALENQLRHAIDNEEFVLHYQPKVNLVSGKVTSAEALIRWNDPSTGNLVPPGMFIPILEETGLIYEVGRWALRKAVENNMRWRSAGFPTIRIAVNVSPLQLRNINFINEIKQVIALDSDAASGLELEITESVIMNNIEFNIATLQAIREMGVTIAIDDFGTGFSSLGYLAKLPVDRLKIDRSFVIAMTAGAEGLALVSTIINLAHSLKLKVVAEGVETDEQSHLLQLLSCDEIQGYLFSKPVPAEIFETQFLLDPVIA
jgi:diguanylate cyclase (GGDEF)-like protein/PAS domain S-box-containing protein